MQDAAVKDGAAYLVCTEKDAVKLGSGHLAVLQMPLWVAEQKVIGAGALLTWVLQRLEGIGN